MLQIPLISNSLIFLNININYVIKKIAYQYCVLIYFLIQFSNCFAANCSGVNNNFSFGEYSPFSSGAIDVNFVLTIKCDNSPPAGRRNIRISAGLISNLYLLNKKNGDKVKFYLFKDFARKNLIISNTELMNQRNIFLQNEEFRINIFGRIIPFENVNSSAGDYMVNIPINITITAGNN